MPAPAKLRIIATPEVAPTPDLAALAAESARKGKHLGDAFRAEIAARDWNRVHIRADRAPALDLVDRIKRTWAR